jgi:hypothetical protein
VHEPQVEICRHGERLSPVVGKLAARRMLVSAIRSRTGLDLIYHILCSARKISAARSPMITQGAMVFPVVTRGMMEPSAMRRFSMP